MLDEKLTWHLSELKAMPAEERIARRLAKFREIARFYNQRLNAFFMPTAFAPKPAVELTLSGFA
jgi:hypothetical protein